MQSNEKSTSPAKNSISKGNARLKKQGGWADDSQPNRTFSALEKRFSSIKLKKQDSEEDGPGTPTIDFKSEEDLTSASQIGQNPTLNQNRAATFKELNANTVSKQNLAHFLDGVDLRMLTKSLLPESQLQETDIPWNWDVLFAEIVPDLSFNQDKSVIKQ